MDYEPNHQTSLSRESTENHKNFLPFAMDTIHYRGFERTLSIAAASNGQYPKTDIFAL